MKLQKHEVCVFIENEAHLQEARELLEKYGEEISFKYFFISKTKSLNFLQTSIDGLWCLLEVEDETQITLSQLETILKEER